MAAVCASENLPVDQIRSLQALRKCFSDNLIISPKLWRTISGQGETVDRVVALSIKPLGFKAPEDTTFQDAMVKTIRYTSEIYSSQDDQPLETIINFIKEDKSAIKVIDKIVTSRHSHSCLKKCMAIFAYPLVKFITGDEHANKNKKITTYRTFFKCLKKCMAIFAYTLGEGVVKNPHIDAYISFHGYLDHLLSNKAKEKYSYRLQAVAKEHLETIFAKIEAIEFSGPSEDKTQVQKCLLEMVCSKAPIENSIKLIDFVHELTASATLWLDFSNSKSLGSFLERLLSCIREDQISIHMMTCPDYSGSMSDGVWHYNFRTLGLEAGFVASRAIGFVTEFAEIAEKFISKVEIHHLLPTHEFIGTGEGFGDHTAKLKGSLEKIQSLYLPRVAQTHLSSELLSDKDFQEKKEEFLKAGIDNAFAKEVLHKRKALYEKFCPEATPVDLLDHAKKQIADYFIVGEMLTKSSHSVLLASDSIVMCKAYVLREVPFLFGKVKGAAHYLGD